MNRSGLKVNGLTLSTKGLLGMFAPFTFTCTSIFDATRGTYEQRYDPLWLSRTCSRSAASSGAADAAAAAAPSTSCSPSPSLFLFVPGPVFETAVAAAALALAAAAASFHRELTFSPPQG